MAYKMGETECVWKNLEDLIENFIRRPEWYRELPESKKCIAKPALDELVKVILS